MNRILIIDDSMLQGKALENILKDEYQVTLNTSGVQGIETAKSLKPTLILLDVIMPGMDGFETLIALKNTYSTRNIPIILITSLADTEKEEKGLTLGAVDYITKPFNPGIIKARVRTHVQLYSYRKAFEQMASLDGLTGIPNRRQYDERSKDLWMESLADQSVFSSALLDIDFFKQYNDCYGHPKGDEVLRAVAQCAYGVAAKYGGLAARYGGEEFVFLLPGADREKGVKIAEEVCRSIEDLRIPHEESAINPYLTVSIGGISRIASELGSYKEIFDTVDTMVYEAKKQGRNRVVWAD